MNAFQRSSSAMAFTRELWTRIRLTGGQAAFDRAHACAHAVLGYKARLRRCIEKRFVNTGSVQQAGDLELTTAECGFVQSVVAASRRCGGNSIGLTEQDGAPVPAAAGHSVTRRRVTLDWSRGASRLGKDSRE